MRQRAPDSASDGSRAERRAAREPRSAAPPRGHEGFIAGVLGLSTSQFLTMLSFFVIAVYYRVETLSPRPLFVKMLAHVARDSESQCAPNLLPLCLLPSEPRAAAPASTAAAPPRPPPAPPRAVADPRSDQVQAGRDVLPRRRGAAKGI